MKNLKNPIKLVSIVWILLLLPLIYTAYKNDGFTYFGVIVSSLGISLFIFAVFSLIKYFNKIIASNLTIFIIIIFFLIRITFSLAYDFSGRGFSSEFFAHFSMHSFLIGFKDYGFIFVIAIVSILFLSYRLIKIMNRQILLPLKLVFILLFLSSTLIYLNIAYVTEINLYKSWKKYTFPLINKDKEKIRKDAKRILAPLRTSNNFPIEKQYIQATLPKKPKNIIIVYLESFSEILTENRDYPNLTPNIDKLKKQHFSFSHNYSSSYVTIEGIADTQCGTLMNMENGNNSLTSSYGRLQNLPCLGDVLKEAGYKQVFYGGADLEFAGKGAFLLEHGYDIVMGENGWKQQKLNDKFSLWGLTDTELFHQAIIKIKQLNKQDSPYNLTLLTLGTHLPGFNYEGCPIYQNSTEEFIQAIHCTDYLLGKFITDLKQKKLLDDTIVYVKGDHTIFPTHKMKSLFRNKSRDRRVLSLIISPDKIKLNPSRATQSLNMAANILDLLDIKHNVNFILGYADANTKTNKPYIITRYADIYEKQLIRNIGTNLNCETKQYISIPLDKCEKNEVINSIYQLGSTYAANDTNFYALCEKGIQANFSKNKKIKLIWGNYDISNLFQHEGRGFGNNKKGIYLVVLNQQGEFLQQLFFSNTNKNHILLNKNISNAKSNKHFLMLTNLSTLELNNIKGVKFSVEFIKNKIAYFKYKKNMPIDLISFNANRYVSFFPTSCDKAMNIISSKNNTNNNFCQINGWGPQKTELGKSFHKQPTGLSAFWLKTDCAPNDATFRIDGQELKTLIKLPIITAAIDNITLLNKSKSYQLELYSPSTNKSQNIGEFKVLANTDKTLFVPKIDDIELQANPPILIAHAGGGYKGKSYLNSLEALNYNYKLGHRLFELDFNWTSDNKLVAIHDWDKTYKGLFNQNNHIPTEKQFMQLQMNLQQTQLNLSWLDEWLQDHPDAYLVTDIRGNNIKALKLMFKQMKTAPKQIIPQMYHPINYYTLREIGYENIIFTLYATHLPTDKLIDFINSHHLFATTINPAKADFTELVSALNKSKKFIYVHTFNSITTMNKYLNLGVNGIYTDFLYTENNYTKHQ